MITIQSGEIQKIEKIRFGLNIGSDTFTSLRIENKPYIQSDEQDTENEQGDELRNLFRNSSAKLEEMQTNISAIMIAAGQLHRLSAKGA